ncbi:hypothetical protein MUU72_06625 [Streptomyces sp. RS10V-4]|uniref:hypothetical protein n=1 Tax=Streptomyces rhizoryzae TaxID=2932493 RepID=UPI0020061D5E|nr:hypothetical protein [Streptomyces rhizoryzae]MCK7622780.1 hypothetical protein [Streptomyces rhizoryzae]
MPTPPITRTTLAAALLAVVLLTVAAALAVPPPHPAPARAACTGRVPTGWSADPGPTAAFARYGDDNSRTDDWTGGDGTHSVRLPDGRTLWLFSDTFLDRIHPPPGPRGGPYRWRTTATGGTPYLRHNSLVVMSPAGVPERTLTGGTPAAPGPFFPDPPGGGWRWPVHAAVEPRAPGSAERVVRVLLWIRAPGTGPWAFGTPRGTEVATLSLPALHLESITPVAPQGATDPARRVLYGAALVRDGGWTYVFGGDDPPSTPADSAYLARAPAGRLADAAAWRFRDGARWQPDAGRAAPVLRGGGRRGVGSAFTVARAGRTWVLLTMDTPAGGAAGLRTLTGYWSCTPQGPWHGPAGRITPPRPAGPDPAHVAVYNPQAHPEFTTGAGLLVSYDVNWLGPPGAPADPVVNGDVELYRPRFLRLRFAPARP